MNYVVKYNCFHGSTDEAIDEILKNKKFHFNKRDDHWLGNGVYFFIDDKSKADWWARQAVDKENKKYPHKYLEPCILYIEANVNKNELLNLNSENDQSILKNFIAFLKKNKIAVDFDCASNDNVSSHILLCHVLDTFSKLEGYKASCYLFPNENKPYLFMELGKYGIMNNKGNQLCVYDQSILNFETTSKLIHGSANNV